MSRKEEKTNQIIQAATTEFLAKGLDAASMHNIAELAEVSKRTLYKYFPSKEELYSALIDEILDRIQDMHQFEYERGGDLNAQLERYLNGKIELTLTEPMINISRIVIGELLKGRQPTKQQLQRLNESEEKFTKWIKAAQQDKKIIKNVSAEKIADQFHSILKGKIFWPIIMRLEDEKNINRTQVKKEMINFLIDSFGNQA